MAKVDKKTGSSHHHDPFVFFFATFLITASQNCEE